PVCPAPVRPPVGSRTDYPARIRLGHGSPDGASPIAGKRLLIFAAETNIPFPGNSGLAGGSPARL
ncbi:MAG: hypothetical protein ACTIID_09885, partial [Brevibacterium linens]|uniref:hypothetical protein n=1 Tax=Brevibacterium linens TaxID=1703 RepID=UPI003F9C005A